jgi:hypothetical protein
MPFAIRSCVDKGLTHLVLPALAFVILSALCPPSCKAQSTDRNNPTLLRTREINGRADYPVPKSGWGRTFYYVFTANAGRWSAKVTTHALEDSLAGVRYNVSFNQLSRQRLQRRRFPSVEVLDPLALRGRDVSIRFSLSRQTRLLMIVNLSGKFDYRISLDGP